MTAEWWANEPDAIVAVLNLANLDDGGLIARTFAPEHADEIERLGEDLKWISRLRTGEGDDKALLSEYFGTPVFGYGFDRRCMYEADRLQADVLVMAEWIVTSLLARRAVA